VSEKSERKTMSESEVKKRETFTGNFGYRLTIGVIDTTTYFFKQKGTEK
jgi:hypothetical protein